MHFYLLTEINRQPTNLPHVEGTRDALLRMSAGVASGPPPPTLHSDPLFRDRRPTRTLFRPPE